MNKDWNRKGNNKNSAWIERKWCSEYKETGGWISTRAPEEVASASSWKQNPSVFWWLLLVYIGGEQPRGRWTWNPNLKWAPSGLDEIQKTQPNYGRPNIILMIVPSSKRIWWWGWIHQKVDFKTIPTSTHKPKQPLEWRVRTISIWYFLQVWTRGPKRWSELLDVIYVRICWQHPHTWLVLHLCL